MKAEGDCFEVAANMIITFDSNKEARLVHGEAIGQGKIAGVPHVHAWVEICDEVVLDFSNGKNIVINKSAYYAIGKIENTVAYTPDETKAKLLETEVYGPWDEYLKTVEGK